jgi:hypothetical protein
MDEERIDLAEQFSPFPMGRYSTQGAYNGRKFRRTFLVPALNRARRVVVDVSKARGLGPSFLDEAFGGLVRKSGFSPEEIRSRLVVQSSVDPSLITEIERYIEKASREPPQSDDYDG